MLSFFPSTIELEALLLLALIIFRVEADWGTSPSFSFLSFAFSKCSSDFLGSSSPEKDDASFAPTDAPTLSAFAPAALNVKPPEPSFAPTDAPTLTAFAPAALNVKAPEPLFLLANSSLGTSFAPTDAPTLSAFAPAALNVKPPEPSFAPTDAPTLTAFAPAALNVKAPEPLFLLANSSLGTSFAPTDAPTLSAFAPAALNVKALLVIPVVGVAHLTSLLSCPGRSASQAAHFVSLPLFITIQDSHFHMSLSTVNRLPQPLVEDSLSWSAGLDGILPSLLLYSPSSLDSDSSSPPNSQSIYHCTNASFSI